MASAKVSPKKGTKRAAKGTKTALPAKNGKKVIATNLTGSTQAHGGKHLPSPQELAQRTGRTRHPSSRASTEPPEWSSIEGIPSERDIAERIQALSNEHARTFQSLMTTLAGHLGSTAAARLWLATPHSGFGEAPIDLIVAGRIDAVVKAQEAIWGPDPAYA